MPLGEQIKKYRKQRKLSQTDLSNLIKEKHSIDIAQNTISQYEKGVREPNLSTIRIIGDALGVTISELVEPTTKEKQNEM